MKILITGGSGLLGKSLFETRPELCEIALTWHKNKPNTNNTWYHLDIRNRTDIFELFEIVKPDIVIHCAAIGNVDWTETHYQEVFEVNATGVKHIVDAANGYKSKLIYISSNAVFSGKHPLYDERSLLRPVNAYGSIKKQAERYIRDMSENWLIIRPFLLYGWPYPGGRANWVTIILDRFASSHSLKLVDDHIWMPTYAPDCADAIWQLLLCNNEIVNVASPERATLYEFGLKVCDTFGLEKNLVKPVKSDYFPSIAKRPKDTTYDLVKLSMQGIMLSDIRTGLEKMKEAKNEDNR